MRQLLNLLDAIEVHIQELGAEDLLLVCQQDSPDVTVDTLKAMIGVNKQVQDAITIKRTIGSDGAPWEFNLRDVLRWIRLTAVSTQPSTFGRYTSSGSGILGTERSSRQYFNRRFQIFPFPSKICALALPLAAFELVILRSRLNLGAPCSRNPSFCNNSCQR